MRTQTAAIQEQVMNSCTSRHCKSIIALLGLPSTHLLVPLLISYARRRLLGLRMSRWSEILERDVCLLYTE